MKWIIAFAGTAQAIDLTGVHLQEGQKEAPKTTDAKLDAFMKQNTIEPARAAVAVESHDHPVGTTTPRTRTTTPRTRTTTPKRNVLPGGDSFVDILFVLKNPPCNPSNATSGNLCLAGLDEAQKTIATPILAQKGIVLSPQTSISNATYLTRSSSLLEQNNQTTPLRLNAIEPARAAVAVESHDHPVGTTTPRTRTTTPQATSTAVITVNGLSAAASQAVAASVNTNSETLVNAINAALTAQGSTAFVQGIKAVAGNNAPSSGTNWGVNLGVGLGVGLGVPVLIGATVAGVMMSGGGARAGGARAGGKPKLGGGKTTTTTEAPEADDDAAAAAPAKKAPTKKGFKQVVKQIKKAPATEKMVAQKIRGGVNAAVGHMKKVAGGR